MRYVRRRRRVRYDHIGRSQVIETFFDRDDEDAHAKFQRWRARHWGDGYFLNYRRPGNVRLHRSPCPHLGDPDWLRPEQGFGSLTRRKKVCSTDQRELAVDERECRDGELYQRRAQAQPSNATLQEAERLRSSLVPESVAQIVHELRGLMLRSAS